MMQRLLLPLALLAFLGCTDDPGPGRASTDAGADTADRGSGDDAGDADAGDQGLADTGPAQDTPPDVDPEDAEPDAPDSPDAPEDAGPDATDADVAPDGADLDTGPEEPPAVRWAERRGLAVAGKRALVLLDGRGRPVVVGPRGGAGVIAYTEVGEERWSLTLRADPINDVAAAIGPDDVLYLFFDFRTLTLDGERMNATGGSDLALVAVSSDGEVLWHEIWGTEESEAVVGLGVDDNGSVYLAGHGDDGTLEVGGARIEGWPSRFQDFWDPAHFLVALDGDRQQRWSAVHGILDVQFSSLTTAGDGTTYVGGNLRKDVDFGSGPTGTPEDGVDLFFAAFSADGANLWTTRLPEPGGGQVLSLGVDGQGRALATAALIGNRITSSNVPSISNRAGGTLLAFDAQGNERFRHTWPVASLWVASRCAGGPLLAGHTLFDPVDFGGGPLPQAGEHDAFLVGLDNEGDHLWSLAVGTRDREVFTGGAGDARRGVAYGAGVATGGGAHDYGSGPTEALSDFDTLVAGVGAP
jgi:hypothetical protein